LYTCSSYGGIHSSTHPRPSTGLAASPSYPPNVLHSQSVSHSMLVASAQSRPSSTARLAAVIRGHLCRRLLSTSKVQSIVKTIKDCQTLLPYKADSSATRHSQTLTLQDINFQERLLDQVVITSCKFFLEQTLLDATIFLSYRKTLLSSTILVCYVNLTLRFLA